MITMYVKTGCPYCAMALAKVDDLGLEINELNIADPGVLDELMEKGGKRQVPYLVDESTGTTMYESADIVDYLEKQYNNKDTSETPPTEN